MSCSEVSFLSQFDKCLKIKIENFDKFAGLSQVDGTSDVFVGKLYGFDGITHMNSRVSMSTDGESHFVSVFILNHLLLQILFLQYFHQVLTRDGKEMYEHELLGNRLRH